MMIAIVLAGFALPAAAQDEIATRGWTPFAEGSWVRYQGVARASQPEPEERPTDRTMRLLRKGETSMVLRLEVGGQAMEQEVPTAWTDRPEVHVEEAGTEEISAAGETYPCRVRRYVAHHERADLTSTVWLSDRIPGELVKMEMTDSAMGAPMTTTLLLNELGQSRTVAGQDVECLVYTIRREGMGYTTDGRMWYSPAVPGGVVRTEAESAALGVRFEEEVVAFEARRGP